MRGAAAHAGGDRIDAGRCGDVPNPSPCGPCSSCDDTMIGYGCDDILIGYGIPVVMMPTFRVL